MPMFGMNFCPCRGEPIIRPSTTAWEANMTSNEAKSKSMLQDFCRLVQQMEDDATKNDASTLPQPVSRVENGPLRGEGWI